jgi:O-antigen/teichoic acid export membrane protein
MAIRYFKESAIYAAGGALSQGITFLLFPFLAHVFSPKEYGIIDILGLVATLASLTIALEINQGLGREVSELADNAQWRIYASTALIFTAVAYTMFALIAMILVTPITHILLERNTNPWIVRVEIAVIWVSGVVYVAQDQLRWRKRATAYACTSLALATGATLTTGVLVLLLDVGVIAALIGQLVGALCAALVLFVVSRHDYRATFDPARCRAMLAYSLPLVLSSIGVFLNGFGDRIAIQHGRSLTAVGVYGVGFRIAAVVSLLLLGFQGSTTPMLLARHRDPATRIELARIFRLFCAIALSVFVTLSVFAEVEVRLVASRSYAGAAEVVPYLVLQSLLFGAYVFAPGLTIAKRTRGMAVIAISAGIINIALAFALVPSFGIRGAGVATLASSAWFFFWNMSSSQRHYHVPHRWRRLTVALTVAVLTAAAATAVLPYRSSEAFALGSLAVRSALTTAAIIVIVALLVEADELAGLRDHLLHSGRRGSSAIVRWTSIGRSRVV